LDEARQRIVPSLGATVYTIDAPEIADLTEGDNVPFGKLALRLPGVSQDSEGSGNFHIRDDHGNVQYRIDDVLIPEGITGFSEDFDTRFAQDVELITGALPAQYGFRTSGILDIHTKSGATAPGGEVEMYGGSNGEVRPSFESIFPGVICGTTWGEAGVDAYYKQATNLIDDGQFGAAPILSAFNYATGQICGVELSQNFAHGPVAAYANLAVEEGLGERVNSAQAVLFNATQ
jgi:outer membrane cobalamin receptor